MAPIGSTAEIFSKLQVGIEKGRILGADDDVGFVEPVERTSRGPCRGPPQ